ncbi:MAG: APC family permease [Gemmatimonadales bacterium]
MTGPTAGSGPTAPTVGLIRTIGRFSLTAIALNTIIGTGVFVLPGTTAGRLGWIGLVGWVLAAGFTAAMIFSFAEVASRFQAAGGAYLFTRVAFGRFAGIQMAWIVYFARVISAAVQANLFSAYLAELVPWVGTRVGGIVATTVFIGALTIANIRSVVSGTRVSDVLASIKVLSLVGFGVLGIVWLAGGHPIESPVPSDPTARGWLEVLLLLMFAYGGFEAALIPLSEAKDPGRDPAVALLSGLAVVTVVYLAAQVTVLATLPDPGSTTRPLAASAGVMLGRTGAVIVSVAALISVYGWLASNMLTVPRLTMAMAEEGELPAFFGRIHPVFRTPALSIAIFGGLSWLLANQAGLLQNLGLSAVSRLFIYGGVCAALPVFRRRDGTAASPGPARYRAPWGVGMAVIGVLISLILATAMSGREALTMALVVLAATIHWWVAGTRRRS